MAGDNAVTPTTLSRAVSHALRHEPWLYELELDEAGWAPLEQLLSALRRQGGPWTGVDRSQVERMIRSSEKERHELRGGLIRAKYGHSLPGRLARTRATPPDVLLHGTSPDAVPNILRTGLEPMGRQYVHLSVDHTTALAVGLRKNERPVVVQVRAVEANARDVGFYHGNEHVWLADAIPPEFISVNPANPTKPQR